MNVLRAALPGFNAETDTDPDHFALFTDEDYVLIKEFTRGSVGITGDGSEVIETIPHNLGYIPLFFVYVLDINHSPTKWKLLAHNTAGASVPPYIAVVDEDNLYIYNFLAAAVGEVQFKYYIFYDDISNSGAPEIVESDKVVKIGKQGVDVSTSLNPNDYIFHSDLNTFKILKEANVDISFTTDGDYTFAHDADIADPTSFLVFVKFPDGKTGVLPGVGVLFSFDSNYNISHTYIDETNIGMSIIGSAPATLHVKYYIFETPLS